MKILPVLRTATMFSAAAALLALSCGGIAYAITSNIFQYSAPKTGYLPVNPMAFAPADSASTSSYLINPGQISVGASGCFGGAINLPDGAQIKGFTSWSSSFVAGSVAVSLVRTNVSVGGISLISTATSQDTSGGRTATNGSIPAGSIAFINNQHFSYGVTVCLTDPDAIFLSARIAYTYTNAGD